jgi:hypothetical protein
MCLKEIGLRARDLLTILGSIVNTVRWTYVVRRSKVLLKVLHAYLRVGCTMKDEDCHLIFSFFYPEFKVGDRMGKKNPKTWSQVTREELLSWLMCQRQHKLTYLLHS